MATTAISNSSIFQELQSFYQSRQSDLQQLASALQSGDLNAAQTAFTALAALGQSGPFANSEPFANSTRAQDFEAVGQALQAGNLTQAQTAFATLQASLNNSQSSTNASPAAVVNLSNTLRNRATNFTPTTDSTNNTSSLFQQIQAYSQQRASDLAQLAKDLQAGNLTAAQQDFQTLTALGQTGPNANGQVFSRTDRNQAFQAIGQALQSGDLAGAQSAFANLQSTFGAQNQQAQSAISAYNQGGVEIVINLISPPSSTGSGSGTGPLGPPIPNPISQPPVTEPPVTEPPVSQPPVIVTGPPVVNSGDGSVSSASGSSSTGAANTGSSSGATPTELIINLESSGAQGIPGLEIEIGNTSGSGNASGSSANSSTPEIVLNLQSGSSSGAQGIPEVTINFGDGSSAPQLSVGTETQNGSINNLFNINLNPQNNYELVLNLLNTGASGQTQNGSSALSVSA